MLELCRFPPAGCEAAPQLGHPLQTSLQDEFAEGEELRVVSSKTQVGWGKWCEGVGRGCGMRATSAYGYGSGSQTHFSRLSRSHTLTPSHLHNPATLSPPHILHAQINHVQPREAETLKEAGNTAYYQADYSKVLTKPASLFSQMAAHYCHVGKCLLSGA